MQNVATISLLLASLIAGTSCYAQTGQETAPFTTSWAIQGEPLDTERAKVLTEFNKRTPKKQTRSALTGGFCKPVITQPAPSPDQVKLALALVESEIAPVVSFANEGASKDGPPLVSYSVEFDLDSVTLRSSNPRYESQTNGLRVAYPHDSSSHVWFEAKGTGSVLFIVPPVRDCSVQFIVACPRTYSNARTLDDAKLTVTGVRYVFSSKADGLFQAPNGEESKVMASTLATSRVELPSSWFMENISKDTPSASVKIQKPLNPMASAGKTSAAAAPFQDAVESHLEFGTTTSVKRVVRSRSTIEVSPFTLETPQPVQIERSTVPLNPGSCFVISRRKETHY
jgi:hypothetical protein